MTGRLAIRLIAILCLCTAIGCAGGVRRRLTIRSNPPGALVFIDNQEVGHTPVSPSFTYYGVREIRLEKDGYETLTVKQKFSAPWYQVPPLDFFSDNFWPREIRDEREVSFQLVPQQLVPEHVLRQRAEQMRNGARQGIATPVILPPTTPATPGSGTLPPPSTTPAPASSAFPLPPPSQSFPAPPG